MKVKVLDYAVASDRGLVRANNEDSAYAGPHLLALADGMGGHAAGEVASQLMINHMKKLDVDPEANDLDMLAVLGTIADEGNRAIADSVRANPETDGMGTTLTSLMFDGDKFGMCHVGDSRGYRLHNGELEQITVDDTFVQSLVNEGKLDPEDVSTHPQRSLILKAYTGRPVEPTLKLIDASVGDRFLLCSDGLSDPVSHPTIEETLREGTPLQAARRLVELALRSGGPDNVTVVVADIVEEEIDAKDTEKSVVPSVPVTAGALNADEPEDPRPNTAAGRAAMMAAKPQERVSQTIEATDDPFSGVEPKESKEATNSRRLKAWIGLLTTVVIIAALAVAGWFGYKKIENHYYITTAEGGRLVVERGVDYEVFGKQLHEPYLWACLDKEGEFKTVDNKDAKCDPFTVDALPPATRDALPQLSGGTLDENVQRLTSLADQALPVCITREPTKGDTVANTEKRAGDLTTPGVNCREVK